MTTMVILVGVSAMTLVAPPELGQAFEASRSILAHTIPSVRPPTLIYRNLPHPASWILRVAKSIREGRNSSKRSFQDLSVRLCLHRAKMRPGSVESVLLVLLWPQAH